MNDNYFSDLPVSERTERIVNGLNSGNSWTVLFTSAALFGALVTSAFFRTLARNQEPPGGIHEALQRG